MRPSPWGFRDFVGLFAGVYEAFAGFCGFYRVFLGVYMAFTEVFVGLVRFIGG